MAGISVEAIRKEVEAHSPFVARLRGEVARVIVGQQYMIDRLLVEAARRLSECVRQCDTVSRLGGDEFVILFSELDHIRECEQALQRIGDALACPFPIGEGEATVSASIGVSFYPGDGIDPDTLLRHADQAMYQAKQAGRNRFHLFDPEHEVLSQRVARIEALKALTEKR